MCVLGRIPVKFTKKFHVRSYQVSLGKVGDKVHEGALNWGLPNHATSGCP